MIDLHCHILPGIDDGAHDLAMSLDMARLFVDQGVSHVACTPHILPGLYHNTGPQIRQAVLALQSALAQSDIPLTLVTGADNHVTPDFVAGLRSGHLLTIADTRYVLVEPPHHVAPPQLDVMFFNLLVAGYVPILTHPERLTWIEQRYDLMRQLASRGVWMQITAGSLVGRFGRRARYWAERMVDEGLVHLLATDAHDPVRRPPELAEGRRRVALRVGEREADHMVMTRPAAILLDTSPVELPVPVAASDNDEIAAHDATIDTARSGSGLRIGDRLRRLFHQ